MKKKTILFDKKKRISRIRWRFVLFQIKIREMLIPWLLIPAGVVVVVKAIAIGDFIGEIDWCEKFIGNGGTYTFIKLFGLATSILSIMWLTGTPQAFLQNWIGHLF